MTPIALSVTFTVKLLDPAVPGVPEIVPPAARLNPAGSDPPPPTTSTAAIRRKRRAPANRQFPPCLRAATMS